MEMSTRLGGHHGHTRKNEHHTESHEKIRCAHHGCYDVRVRCSAVISNCCIYSTCAISASRIPA